MIARARRLDLIPPYLFGQMAAIKRKAIAEGRDVIDLGIGDPDLPTPGPIVDALAQAARNPETHRYDESRAGWPPFLQAAARYAQRRFGAHVDPQSEIALLVGSKEGLAHLAWAFIDAGDLALCPDPAYTVYRVNSLLAGGEVYPMPLTRERGFLPDLGAIPTETARRARILWLNYPNNPTGARAPLSFFEEAVAFARDYDVLLVNDAAYVDVYYEAPPPPSVLQVPGAKEVAIELHSLSKTFNMTGWRIGFAMGNADAVAALNTLKSNLDSKQFPAISEAAAHALLHVDNRATLNVYRKRRDTLCDGLKRIGWDVTAPSSTIYVWSPTPGGEASGPFAARLLEEADVHVIPGSGYGEYGEGYVRMSLTVPGDREGERMAEAVDRIERFQRS